MKPDATYRWLILSERRKRILITFHQPLTATQIAKRQDISLDSTLHILWGLTRYGVTYCLNPGTRHSRLHWLTKLGKAYQQKLRDASGLDAMTHAFPKIPWDLYSSVCYSHRSAVIKVLREPMQAAVVKRRARLQNRKLKMSANNTRDVMRYLHQEKIVRKFRLKKKQHPRYELTDLGKTFRELLVGASLPNR